MARIHYGVDRVSFFPHMNASARAGFLAASGVGVFMRVDELESKGFCTRVCGGNSPMTNFLNFFIFPIASLGLICYNSAAFEYQEVLWTSERA